MQISRLILAALVLVGCSAAGGQGSPGQDRETPYGPLGSGGNVGSPGTKAGAAGSLQLTTGGTAADGSTGGSTSCATESQQAPPTPADILVLLDQSGSMTLEGDRWNPTSQALKAFVSAPTSQGLGVGLQYFPLGAKTTEDPAICVAANYVNPDVPIGLLPGNTPALTASIDAHYFTAAQGEDAAHWGTPTRPAVEGALTYLAQQHQQSPERRQYLLLATDGKPSKLCPGNDVDGIAQVLATAAAQIAPVQTFVIGIGELDRLNLLADSGGTGLPAFIVDATGAATQAQLSAALAAIRESALPCDYTIPRPASGKLDPEQVNVQFTGDGGDGVWPKVVGATACSADQRSWYYDNEVTPTKVVMCPAACAALKRGGRIDLLFGCKTVVQ